MTSLGKKILLAETLIKFVAAKYSRDSVFIAWSGGKESTVLLYIVASMYRGKIPFPVFFLDSGTEPIEVYDHINKVSKLLALNLIRNPVAKKQSSKKIIMNNNKNTIGLDYKNSVTELIKKKGISVTIKGVRWRDHNNQRKVFLLKENGAVSLCPLLHFEEKDIWNYIYKYNIPYVSLYEEGYRELNDLHLNKVNFVNKIGGLIAHQITKLGVRLKPNDL